MENSNNYYHHNKRRGDNYEQECGGVKVKKKIIAAIKS